MSESARARVHAMFPLDEMAEQELDARLDALVAETRNEDAALLQERAARYPSRRIFAAGLRHGALMIAKLAMGKTSPSPAAAPVFFQVGHTYSDDQYGWKFRVDHITTHPEDGERTALGWRFFNGEWDAIAYDEGDWEIHQLAAITDVTEEVSR